MNETGVVVFGSARLTAKAPGCAGVIAWTPKIACSESLSVNVDSAPARSGRNDRHERSTSHSTTRRGVESLAVVSPTGSSTPSALALIP